MCLQLCYIRDILKIKQQNYIFTGNVVKYYSKVDDIKTLVIRSLKANRKNWMLIFKLYRF